jgi:peptidoglycan/xylan/chitin deacetylase (PgdA/CDA1 family)
VKTVLLLPGNTETLETRDYPGLIKAIEDAGHDVVHPNYIGAIV